MPDLFVERNNETAVIKIIPPAGLISDHTIDELNTVTSELDQDQSCRAMVLTGGEGDVFVRHFNVNILQKISSELRDKGSIFDKRYPVQRERVIDQVFRRLEETPKITIAAINGFAMGGGFEICLACDFRIAQAGDYHLGLPEVKIGILPGAGGTQRLARLIGRARAMELILRGRTVTPDEALQIGLVNEISEDSALDHALRLADELAAKAPTAVGHIKFLLNQGSDVSINERLIIERTLFLDALTSDDGHRLMSKMIGEGLDIRDVS